MSVSRDFDRRNTTLSAALNYARDTIFPAISFDLATRRPKVARTIGNWMPELSGRAIKENAIGYVVEIFRRTRLPIIGIGGVTTWEDAAEMIIAGATGVGVCTAAMVDGPKVFGKLARGLGEWLEEQGCTMDGIRGSGLEGIRQVTDQTTDGTKRTAVSIGQLANLAVELKGSVSGFKV